MKTKISPIKHIVFYAMCFVLFLTGCNNQKSTNSSNNQVYSGECLADTIIYSVVIKNLDPLDTWTEKCLSKLKREKMVDQIFEAIYSHNAVPYNYNNNQELSIADIKNIEAQEEFSRDEVGKLQFWESWYFDKETQRMQKKVHSILVAYAIKTEEGELRGYKAAFYIKMKN